MKKTVYSLIFVFCSSYLLNFFWESLHAVYLYKDHAGYPAEFFLKMIIYASFVDAFFISLIFVVGCFIFGKQWLKYYNRLKISYTIIFAVIIATIIEIKAFYFNQWSYTELMPTIFGLGLSPLVQLAITGIIVFKIVKNLSQL